jgi:Ca-activated chloride channel homolog
MKGFFVKAALARWAVLVLLAIGLPLAWLAAEAHADGQGTQAGSPQSGSSTSGAAQSAVIPTASQIPASRDSTQTGAAPATPAPSSAPQAASPSKTPSVPAEAEKAASPGTPAPASGSSDKDAGSDDVPRFKVGTNEVNVVFTVTDKHGRRITDLKQSDFHVVDDSKPAAEIRSFHNETNLPLQVGLLIDASNSVRDRFKFEQESAIEFLNQTVRRRYDLAFVVGFDATPEVTQDFTDDTEALAHGVRELRPGGGTALYDALYYACRDKLLKKPLTEPTRRAIILLSDGEDNLSHVTREEAIEMAQRAEAVVYTISTNITGSKGSGDKVLERIADATGGHPFFPFQIRDVSNAFGEIQDELRSQYAVSYKPADFKADGHYRTIEIVANDRKTFHVRARRGYYAPTLP